MRLGTPFGEMVSVAMAGALDTLKVSPAEHRLLSGGREHRRWRTDAVQAELLIGPYRPSLPPEMAVQGCVAAVWRVQALDNITGVAFSCHWNALPEGAVGGPSSGEGLEALTWRVGQTTLSLGTEDGEYLAARAPARLAADLDTATVRYTDTGLSVPFPPLVAGELVQAHFLIAWAILDEDNRHHTWFAVDQPHSEILRQLGMNG